MYIYTRAHKMVQQKDSDKGDKYSDDKKSTYVTTITR